MSKLREVAEAIAETCEWNAAAPGSPDEKERWRKVASVLRAALAEQAQWVACTWPRCDTSAGCAGPCKVAPPREPVRLSDDEIGKAAGIDYGDPDWPEKLRFARAVERAVLKANGLGGSDE